MEGEETEFLLPLNYHTHMLTHMCICLHTHTIIAHGNTTHMVSSFFFRGHIAIIYDQWLQSHSLTYRWTNSYSWLTEPPDLRYCLSNNCGAACLYMCLIFWLCVKCAVLFLCLVLQASLNKLMETLGQSEPYFVKCIRSNAEKVQCARSRLQPLRLFWFSFQSIFHFLWSLNFSKAVYHFPLFSL